MKATLQGQTKNLCLTQCNIISLDSSILLAMKVDRIKYKLSVGNPLLLIETDSLTQSFFQLRNLTLLVAHEKHDMIGVVLQFLLRLS